MAVHVITQIDQNRDPMTDRLYRQQLEHARRQDPKEVFETVEVSVDDGKPDKDGHRPQSAVQLRYALDSNYIFAVYGENEYWHSRSTDEWKSAAKDGLVKFAAIRNRRVVLGPRDEDSNRYNVMLELDQPVKMNPETVARIKAFEEEAEHNRRQQNRRDER
jgi:hypothetical protein